MVGLFPPSSSVTRFKLFLAAASWTLRPIAVESVKEILSIFICEAIAALVSGPPITMPGMSICKQHRGGYEYLVKSKKLPAESQLLQ
jgi:hypothetical protein